MRTTGKRKAVMAAAVIVAVACAALLATPAQAAPDRAMDAEGAGWAANGTECGNKSGSAIPFHPAKETADLLGIDRGTLFRELSAGRTLAQIAQDKAGWSESTLVGKLRAAATAQIDADLKAGKIAKDEADRELADLDVRLKKAVSAPGDKLTARHHVRKREFGPWVGLREAADILGMTPEQVKAELHRGKSLAEIAKAKGIEEDELIARLKDRMTDPLKKFVEHKHPARADNQKR